MAIDPFEIVRKDREAFAAARAHRVQLEVSAARAELELAEIERVAKPGDAPLAAARAKRDDTRKSLQDAWIEENLSGQQLGDHVGDFFHPPDPFDVDPMLPIVFLPVRIETRFIPEREELRVRIYPDEISVDMHEEALTASERAAGERFWRAAWNSENEPTAWGVLAEELTSTRAAFVAKALEPTNLATRPAGAPLFPSVPERPESMHRSVETWVMPERWVVVGYAGGGQAFIQWSAGIEEPLPLTPDPNTNSESITLDGDLAVDTASAWTFDYDRALRAGMAVTIRWAGMPIDRIVVAGIKMSFGGLDHGGATFLRRLLDGHHYSSGLSFIAQGTPTNNTTGQPSGYPTDDPGGAVSFAIERGGPLARTGSDGAAVAAALGLPSAVFDHVTGADGTEQHRATAMADALWPVTLGYYLEQMMDPLLDPDAIRRVRDYYRTYVRGRGPLPAMRVASTPYGFLPVTSLELYQQDRKSTGIEGRIAQMLKQLHPFWMNAVPRVPHAGASSDPDAELMAILSQDASAREVRVRTVRGEDAISNLFDILNLDRNEWFGHQRIVAGTLLRQLDITEPAPRLLGVSFSDTAFRFASPLVAKIVAEDVKLPFDYIRWLRLSRIHELRDELLPDGVDKPTALLYRLLRHAALVEYERLSRDLHVLLNPSSVFAQERRAPELVGIVPGTLDRPTSWQRFDSRIPALSQTATVADYLTADVVQQPTRPRIEAGAYRAALAGIEGLSTAELERLFTETLDVNSHRLDSWITSLATHRLGEMRKVQPEGVHIGIYAWAENLQLTPSGRTAQSASGGYIHAPSMTHAATAAILRNAHLTRRGTEQERYAVDLSSERVRRARWFLDGVRAGQAIGALLGYQFERGLHDQPIGLDLDQFIDGFRALFPLLANKLESSEENPDLIAARNVVDGLALYGAHRDAKLPLNTFGFTTAQRTAVLSELERLGDSIDCVADLLLAESVHQLVLGSTDAATTSMDSFAAGSVRPPDPAIAQTPRGGTQLTHRLGLVVGGSAPASAWSVALTPRGLAQPHLDVWIGTLLGKPEDIRCIAATGVATAVISLTDLGLRPLDVLALATETAADGLSELDRRVAHAAYATLDEGQPIEIRYAGDPAWAGTAVLSFAEAFEIARAAAEVVRSGRSMRAEDLQRPEDPAPPAQPAHIESDLRTRATTAATRLETIAASLRTATTPAALRTALIDAAGYGIGIAFPASRNATDDAARADLTARADAASREAAARVQRAGTAGTAAEAMQALFGRDFRVLVPFVPANPIELGLARTAGTSLGADSETVRNWWQQCARVRPPVGRWRAADMLCRVIGTANFDLDILQIPHAAHTQWVALPFTSEDARPPSGLVSIALRFAGTPSATGEWIGVMLDEWSETIPLADQATGIAFHYDDPGAEAAQTILLAVPPVTGRWNVETVLAILNETLNLAKIRAVDLEQLGELGQLLPAVFVSGNLQNEAVSTTFFGSLAGEQFITTRSS